MQQGSIETLSERKFAGTDSWFYDRRRISPRFSAKALLKKPYADAFIVPKFSTATGWKMCVLSKTAYLVALRVAAASAA